MVLFTRLNIFKSLKFGKKMFEKFDKI